MGAIAVHSLQLRKLHQSYTDCSWEFILLYLCGVVSFFGYGHIFSLKTHCQYKHHVAEVLPSKNGVFTCIIISS